jgi:cellobiose phosphorylase
LRRCGDRLYIRPCIPREWPGFTARYRYGSASYEIVVDNTASKGGAPTSLTVDGREVDWAGHGTENGPFIELRDDGRVHHVAVTL